MNSLAAILDAALQKAKSLNSGSLSFLKDGTTPVTASVYRSFLKDYNRDMAESGYEESFDNLHVMAKPSDVSGWGLQPMTSIVTLDGVQYMVGRTTTNTPGYFTIWLRIKK